jgi:predicted  nucleic acid-binding Zn-ribbon protein
MMRRIPLFALLAVAAACTSHREAARADSLQAIAHEQAQLTNQLAAQKDSLTRVIFEADEFISKVDSQISTVKGLPTSKQRKNLESPIEEQLVARREMLARVDALVKRAKLTTMQLAESRRREAALRAENGELKDANAKLQQQIAQDQQTIEELGERIRKQTDQILALQGQVDSLNTEVRAAVLARNKAYYVIGTERELVEKGIIEREGGARLLVVKLGRSLQPARDLKPELFTPIDAREVTEIQVPDSTRRYRLVSRQSLDEAVVIDRNKATFTGNLRITNPERFWAPSRFLILVQR